MRLASGVIRLPEMRARNMMAGLGLDGGTNDTSDMFNDMRAAVGLDSEIGSLTPGEQADLQMIDAQDRTSRHAGTG